MLFGDFLRQKRLEKGINLRALARDLNITPAYMSDIEKNRRNPPDKEKLDAIIKILDLNENEQNELYDLAADKKAGGIAPDISSYVNSEPAARIALRKARDMQYGEEEWMKVLRMLEERYD